MPQSQLDVCTENKTWVLSALMERHERRHEKGSVHDQRQRNEKIPRTELSGTMQEDDKGYRILPRKSETTNRIWTSWDENYECRTKTNGECWMLINSPSFRKCRFRRYSCAMLVTLLRIEGATPKCLGGQSSGPQQWRTLQRHYRETVQEG